MPIGLIDSPIRPDNYRDSGRSYFLSERTVLFLQVFPVAF